uniref:Uncharacterized protein n=1 Tax=Caenorhabditis japonica TaxID=281687 RepID=A0A8R1IIQ0_CAEJA
MDRSYPNFTLSQECRAAQNRQSEESRKGYPRILQQAAQESLLGPRWTRRSNCSTQNSSEVSDFSPSDVLWTNRTPTSSHCQRFNSIKKTTYVCPIRAQIFDSIVLPALKSGLSQRH